MFIFDQLKKGDRPLQLLAAAVLVGVAVLYAGLWWVQIVSSKRYQSNQQKQMLRSVRVPAVRGRILDREGRVLAENRPQYNVNVYFEEVRDQFWFHYTNSVRPQFTNQNPGVKFTAAIRSQLQLEARYRAVSNITFRVSSILGEPRALVAAAFFRHYTNYPYVPFTICENLTSKQVAIFSEQLASYPGVELEAKSTRFYPNGSTAAHLLGYVHEEKEIDDEEMTFNYSMPDYIGEIGAEAAFDGLLRGKPGVKTLVVNSTQYRQREEMSVLTEPGQDIRLTIDLDLQLAAERALASAMAATRGAAVVMDVNDGDILAMASCPTFDPNMFTRPRSQEETRKLGDEHLRPMFNRATFGKYTPGSIFKIITAIAVLESGISPGQKVYTPGYWQSGRNGKIIDDTASAGDYDFERAFKRSSNTYFIEQGLKAGLPKIVEVGRRFHLGEKTMIPTRQEVAGDFPSIENLSRWKGYTPNVCIGQEITVTPLQMACVTAAVANGGKLFWPRVSFVGLEGEPTPAGWIRDQIHFNPRHLEILRHAMLSDVEIFDGEEGTGRGAYLPNFKIAGKTGTAEVSVHGRKDKNTWFASYAPYESPRYAVIVLVESGGSGGGTCAPVARKIYEAILKRESNGAKQPALATLN